MKHKTITCLLISVALLVGATHSKACTSIIVSCRHELCLAEFFAEPFPARSAVAVKTLPKGALVEIEVIAEV